MTIQDMHGDDMHFTITDEILYPETGLEHEKLLCLQRIEWSDGRPALRMGYYMYTTNTRGTSYWVWGQFSAFILAEDWRFLHEEAKRRKWF